VPVGQKVRDVVGLYLDLPEAALVLCVGEKAQIQALDRTAPAAHPPARLTHGCVRHGVTSSRLESVIADDPQRSCLSALSARMAAGQVRFCPPVGCVRRCPTLAVGSSSRAFQAEPERAGADLESMLGATLREFESRILRHL
jgi:hypothetical protein